jgi:hypothetical protein
MAPVSRVASRLLRRRDMIWRLSTDVITFLLPVYAGLLAVETHSSALMIVGISVR